MARTALPGNRTLLEAKGERQLCPYSKTQSVFVTIPEGYVITDQRGIDFSVQHVRKLATFGDANANSGLYPSIGLYLGDCPSAAYKGSAQFGSASCSEKKSSGINKRGRKTAAQ